MAFPYNPDHRGYSDLESLLRGDFDAGGSRMRGRCGGARFGVAK